MNTRLELLFEKYHISEKNRYEISQIYILLPDIKKQNLINNFEALAFKLNRIEEEIETERKILVPNLLNDLEEIMQKAELKYLKNEIK